MTIISTLVCTTCARVLSRKWPGTYLSSLPREIVDGLLRAADAFVKVRISAVVSREDGVLEAARVLEVEVELAVLAAFGDSNTGADGSDVLVENECQGCLVSGNGGADACSKEDTC